MRTPFLPLAWDRLVLEGEVFHHAGWSPFNLPEGLICAYAKNCTQQSDNNENPNTDSLSARLATQPVAPAGIPPLMKDCCCI